MSHRAVLRSLLPPAALRAAGYVEDALARATGRAPRRIRFTGDYPSWEAALNASGGYDDAVILQRTLAAARRVQAGEVAYERDSVAFAEPDYRYPLLWSIYRAALRHGRLRLIDFGGALGSAYFQHRHVLPDVADLHWAVVEQPQHVRAGAAEFASSRLTFHETIDDALAGGPFDVVLLSGVIQCLPDPYAFVRSLADRSFGTLIFDRLPLMQDGSTRLTVQHVPAAIYPATYPAWFLSEPQLRAALAGTYDIVAAWPALDDLHPEGARAYHRGLLCERQ